MAEQENVPEAILEKKIKQNAQAVSVRPVCGEAIFKFSTTV